MINTSNANLNMGISISYPYNKFSLFFVNLILLVHYHQERFYAQQEKQILYWLVWLDWLVYG